jgi:hypothetical protein
MEGKIQYTISENGFLINRSENFIALLNFYARHPGVKITGPYIVHRAASIGTEV